MRNNTVVAIITHRTSTLDTLPNALNQSEIGFASDANRLFIGNPNNPEMQTRTVFPYQNVEILTEFSELNNYVKYSYVNNIDTAAGETDRGNLIEQIPILIECSEYLVSETAKKVVLNGVEIDIPENTSLADLIGLINVKSEQSYVTASSVDDVSLYLFCTRPELIIGGSADILNVLGVPAEHKTLSEFLPQRKLVEKLDDTLYITDYGIKPNRGNDVSKELATALVGVYGRYPDAQFKREVFFPAGTYLLEGSNTGKDYSIPLLSGTNLRGEGIDRTIIQSDETLFDSYIFQSMDANHNYAGGIGYKSDGVAAENIILRDMTIICNSGKGVFLLRNTKNVVLQNVRVVGGSSGDTIKIYGDGGEGLSQDILIDGSKIERGNRALVIEKNTKNILVNNTMFSDSNENFVVVGTEEINDCNVRAVSFDNNIFTNSNSTTVLNQVYGGSEYITFTNSTFDKEVSEYTGSAPHPFNAEFNASGKNYTDTLDPTTDTRKVLQFRFRQPQWVYLDKLITSKGVLGINVRDNEEEIPVSEKQFLDVVVRTDTDATGAVSEKLDINVAGTPDVVDMNIVNNKGGLSVTADKNIVLDSTNGYIVAKSDIDLVDNALTNQSGIGNLTFKTTDDKIVVIEDVDPTKPYASRANNVGNAVVTVDMLNGSGYTYSYEIAAKDAQLSDGVVLVDDLATKYQDGLKLKSIELNFKTRNHLVKQYAVSDAVKYESGYEYYTGDVIKGEGATPAYYVATGDFTATYDTAVDGVAGGEALKLVGTDVVNGAKFVDILVEDAETNKFYAFGAIYDLTGKANQTIDCSRVDTFNTSVKNYAPFMTLNKGDIVEYQDNLYKAVNPTVDTVTAWDEVLPELDLTTATSVTKLEITTTNALDAGVIFSEVNEEGNAIYYKIVNGELSEIVEDKVSTAELIIQNGNPISEVNALTSLPFAGKNLNPVIAVVMEDLGVVSNASYVCTYKHLVDEVETEATLNSGVVKVFDPGYIKDDADARILWLHNPDKFEKLNTSVGYSYEITGANGVKTIAEKTTVEGGVSVDLTELNISKAKVYLRFFDSEQNLLQITETNYGLFSTFEVQIILEAYK